MNQTVKIFVGLEDAPLYRRRRCADEGGGGVVAGMLAVEMEDREMGSGRNGGREGVRE